MKYLYTTKPDKHCTEKAPGIYGRPTHTTEQPKLRKLGWVDSIHSLKEAGHGLRKDEKEGRKEEGQVKSESDVTNDFYLRDRYYKTFGKHPHHKMKAETIRKKLEEGND